MRMNLSRIAVAVSLVFAAGAPAARAGVHVSIGFDPFGIVTAPPPPVVYAPPSPYAPPPAYAVPPTYAPPIYAAPPVYEPPPVVYLGGGRWGGWGGHRDWHHDDHHHH